MRARSELQNFVEATDKIVEMRVCDALEGVLKEVVRIRVPT